MSRQRRNYSGGCASILVVAVIAVTLFSLIIKNCDGPSFNTNKPEPTNSRGIVTKCPQCSGTGYVYTFHDENLHKETKKVKIMAGEYKEKTICTSCLGKGAITL